MKSYKDYLEDVLWADSESPVSLKKIPKKYLTEEMYLAYLDSNPKKRYKEIPDEAKTDSFCLKAFTDFPCLMEGMSPELLGQVFHRYVLNDIKELSLEQMLTHSSESIRKLGLHIQKLTKEASKV